MQSIEFMFTHSFRISGIDMPGSRTDWGSPEGASSLA